MGIRPGVSREFKSCAAGTDAVADEQHDHDDENEQHLSLSLELSAWSCRWVGRFGGRGGA